MSDAPPEIEVGWLVAGPLSPLQRHALQRARKRVRDALADAFPGFDWRMPLVEREGGADDALDEPVVRLQQGAHERDARGWDFALVLTARDLRSYYKSFALAVPSRALDVAVLSLARLAPDDAREEHAAELALARRVAALALHLIGDLNGLWHRDEPDRIMHPPDDVQELDAERAFAPDEVAALRAALDAVADLRLEELQPRRRALPFYLRASVSQLGEIASAVVQARPWEFPLRLSRLSTAALSALFVLLITAEVWDLGTSQHPAAVAVLSLLALAGTTAFILARQKLILRRARRGPTEQAVVTNVSATLVVLFGMTTGYALLFALTLAAGTALFSPELIARWAPSVRPEPGLHHLLVLAGLVSSLGLLIGSLGASFEGHHYFQHVIYADEET